MIALSYVSCATNRFTHDELVGLLEICHKSNKQLNITGMLLYNGKSSFLQVLEGEEETVKNLYEVIKKDVRHHRVTCISIEPISQRSFADWKMGFRNLSSIKLENKDGFSDFISQKNATDKLQKNASLAHKMLDHFRNETQELIF